MRFDVHKMELAIEKEIERQILEAVDAAAEEAAEKARQAVKDKVGQIAMRLASEYSLRTMGNHMVIEVRMKDPDR